MKIGEIKAFRQIVFNKCVNCYKSAITTPDRLWEGELDLFEKANLNEYLFKKNNIIPFGFNVNDSFKLSDYFSFFVGNSQWFKTEKFEFQPFIDTGDIENEVILSLPEHANLPYKPMDNMILAEKNSIVINDIKQGQCGDCYFLATLAAIARKQPDFIENILNEVKNNIFQVKFVNSNGEIIDINVNDKFWLKDKNSPIYVDYSKKINGNFEIWPMVIEKAWAKLNDNEGYSGIVGSNNPQFEYSYALTGKKAFYMSIDGKIDEKNLLSKLKAHFNEYNLPITLYSVNNTTEKTDSFLVPYHAYALWNINNDDTFNIYNPWGKSETEQNVKGQHYLNKPITFILDNFDTIIFFDIERNLNWGKKSIDFISQQIIEKYNSLGVVFAIDEWEKELMKIVEREAWYLDLKNITVDDLLGSIVNLDELCAKLNNSSNILFRENGIKNIAPTCKRELNYIVGFKNDLISKKLQSSMGPLEYVEIINSNKLNLYKLYTSFKSTEII